MRNAKIFIFLILLSFSISSNAQSSLIEIVRNKYPEIYLSITQDAYKQWGSDESMKQSVVEGQAQAFIEIMESLGSINNDAMTDAIVNGSLPGAKNYNISVINDLTISNPFPRLKCDWYKVKIMYNKSISARESQKNRSGKESGGDIGNGSIGKTYRSDNSKSGVYQRTNSLPRKSNDQIVKPFSIGANLRMGLTTMLDVGSDNSVDPGLSIETGMSGIYRLKNGIFFATDVNFTYSNVSARIKLKSKYYDYEYSVSKFSVAEMFYVGAYQKLNQTIRLHEGLGPFCEYVFNSDDDYFSAHFDYGVGMFFGIELKNRFQFGIYPRLSLNDDYLGKVLTINLGTTFWFN